MFFNRLLENIHKSPAFSKYGQASGTYRGMMLGFTLAVGLQLAIFGGSVYNFGLFVLAWSIFHVWEYTFNALYHPSTLSSDDFLLYQSPQFVMALVAAVIEYWTEYTFVPSLKALPKVVFVGAVLVAAGQTMRILAMVTCSHNFTHQIAEEKRETHELVTHGVYNYFRHPGYCGWYWWAVATQLLLCNPICLVAYAVVARQFFKDRIRYEEATLREYFGEDYTLYCKRTRIGIPLIGR